MSKMYIMSFFIIGMGILGFIIKPRDIKKYSLVVIIGLTTLAFFFQAKAGDDLNIAFTHLEGLKKNGWEYYSQIASKTSYFNMLPTLKIYFYVISRLPSQHFLPAISIFLIYYCAFWIIIKITNKYKLNATMSVALIFILLITLDYYGLVSGIRNALAYAICAVFLYKDLIENENKMICWFVYFSMLGLHSSVIFIIILRVLVFLPKRIMSFVVVGFFIMWMSFANNIFGLLSNVNIPVFQTLAWKLEIYSELGGVEQNLKAGIYYTRLMISRGIFSIVILMTIVYRVKTLKYKLDNMEYLFIYIVSLMFGSFNSFNIFLRLSNMAIFLGSIMLARYYFYRRKTKYSVIVGKRFVLYSFQLPTIICALIIFCFIVIHSYYSISFAF